MILYIILINYRPFREIDLFFDFFEWTHSHCDAFAIDIGALIKLIIIVDC